MFLRQLFDMYESGALNIKYEVGSNTAIMGNMQITLEQAHTICMNLGWEKYVLSPFEIIDKTAKFVKSMRTSLVNESIINNCDIKFKNVRSSTYGKTHDRIHFTGVNGYGMSIIYNMPGNSSKYVLYESLTATPIAKGRTLKQIAEYMNTR